MSDSIQSHSIHSSDDLSSRRITALSNAFGPSACEQEVRSLVESMLPYGTDAFRDPIGNLYMRPEGISQTPIVLDAHMDEVGFMIHSIASNGLLRFQPLGGIDPFAACGQNIQLKTSDGALYSGVISAPAVHFRNGSAPCTFDDLRIDIGCTSKEEAESLGIQPGDFAVFEQHALIDPKRRLVFGKALDDRIGLAAMLAVYEKLAADCQVQAVATVQEEAGERGIQAAIPNLHADYALVFEGAPADDPESDEPQTSLGKGVMVRAKDRSMITDPALMQLCRECAADLQIPLQVAVRTGGGTNAGLLHTRNIPSLVIGIPVRYAHSARGIASLDDFDQAVTLACELVRRLSEQSACLRNSQGGMASNQ